MFYLTLFLWMPFANYMIEIERTFNGAPTPYAWPERIREEIPKASWEIPPTDTPNRKRGIPRLYVVSNGVVGNNTRNED